MDLLPHQPRLLIDGEAFEIGPYLVLYRATAEVQELEPAVSLTDVVSDQAWRLP